MAYVTPNSELNASDLHNAQRLLSCLFVVNYSDYFEVGFDMDDVWHMVYVASEPLIVAEDVKYGGVVTVGQFHDSAQRGCINTMTAVFSTTDVAVCCHSMQRSRRNRSCYGVELSCESIKYRSVMLNKSVITAVVVVSWPSM